MSQDSRRGVPLTEDLYTDEQYDQAFAQTLRSDLGHIVTRVVTLGVVFWIMGRAILVHDVSAGFLLLPLAVELLSIFWIGLFMSWFLVDCPAFAATARKPGVTLFWTILTAIIISMVIAVDDDNVRFDRVLPGWVEGWQIMVDTGLVWALLAEQLALVYSSVSEIFRWRKTGGVFIWTSIMDSALRITGLILGLTLGFFVFGILGELIQALLEDYSPAWMVFSFLLCVEIIALVIGVKVHQEVLREQAGTAPDR